MRYRTAVIEDVDRLVRLYKIVADMSGGIVRLTHEITVEYVQEFCGKSLKKGLIIVGEHPDDANELVAEIHAYKPSINAFEHVFSSLTLVVHPDFHGRKIGRTILSIFLEEVARNHPDVGRVELITRETNNRAIQLYQSMGFLIEGRLEMRVKGKDGHYEADIPMGWHNPNFEF